MNPPINPQQAMMLQALAGQQDPQGQGPPQHPIGGQPMPTGAPVGANQAPLEELMKLIAPQQKVQEPTDQLAQLLQQILQGSGPDDPQLGPAGPPKPMG